jgi:hypothetical protein
MCEMRCASGWSASNSTPGTSSRSSFSTAARNSSRFRPDSGFIDRMYSLRLTGSACSSSSARPVRRVKWRTGPAGFAGVCRIVVSLASMSAAASLDAFRDEPAGRTTLICTEPSSNFGRKSAPSVVSRQPQYPTTSQVTSSSTPACRMLNRTR